MRLKLVFLLTLLSLLVVASSTAQEGDDLKPIIPDNADQVRQLRILRDVSAWDAAWSPSGAQLAIGTLDGVLLCHCDSFEGPEMLENFQGINAYRVAWSPDGTLLAVGTAGSPARILLQDMRTNAIGSLEVEADVLSLAFNPDGSLLAAGLADGEGVVVISTEDGSEVGRYPADIPVEALAFTLEDSELIYPSGRESLRLQRVGDQPGMEITSPCTTTDLRISRDGTQMLTATFDCCVNLFDLSSGNILYSKVCGQSFSVDFNLDGTLFATGNHDGTMHFFRTDNGDYITSLNANQDQITRLSFHPDGTRIVTVGLDNTVRVFGISTAGVTGGLPCDTDVIPEGEPSGIILYHTQPVAGGPGALYSVQAWCGKLEKLIDGALYPAWSPDGKQIAFQYVDPGTGQFDGLWLADADGTNLRRVPGSEPQDRAPTWSPDGKYLAFESVREGASGIFVVELASGAVTPLLSSQQVAYEQPAWSPDGKAIAYILRQVSVQGETRQLYVISDDGSNPRRLADLDHVLSASWSPDGKQLVIGVEQAAFSSSIVLVDVESGEYRTLAEGASYLLPTWSPDRNFIAFVRGDTLMMVQANGEEERVVLRLADTFGSTGLSWKEFVPDELTDTE
jgi:WD40 repeat protein